MSADPETRRMGREAAGYLRAAQDQLDAAYQDLVRRGLIVPVGGQGKVPPPDEPPLHGKRQRP